MDCKPFTVCLLLLLSLVSCAEVKLSGELHYNQLTVTLQNQADYPVSLNLKAQLKQKTENWKLLDTIDCGGNFSLEPHGFKEVECSYTAPQQPGEYKIYARADIVNSTYTYKDFKFEVGSQGFKEPEPESDVTLQFLSAPEKVKTGEEFSVIVNVTAFKEVSLEVYSYVHEGKECHSFYGWKGNSQRHEFKEKETKTINLTDSVSHSTPNGTYQLKVRAREEKDHDIFRPIGVEQVEVDLFKDIPITENSEPQTAFPPHLLLLLLALVPLIIIALKYLL